MKHAIVPCVYVLVPGGALVSCCRRCGSMWWVPYTGPEGGPSLSPPTCKGGDQGLTMGAVEREAFEKRAKEIGAEAALERFADEVYVTARRIAATHGRSP